MMTKLFSLTVYLLLLALFVSMIGPADAQANLTILHGFSALPPSYTNADGALPMSPLALDGSGNLFGAAYAGGASGGGTVFSITPNGVFKTLLSFNGSDGASPLSVMIGNDGALYGTTFDGGVYQGGTIFRWGKTGMEMVLHSFSFLAPYPFINGDGSNPQPGLIQGTDGNFYGTASFGGTSGDGVVYKITSLGVFTVLANFNGTNGAQPYAGVVQGSDGSFYGTTSGGGGTVYKITPDGQLTNLYTFGTTQTDGVYPRSGLIEGTDGNFYGTTTSGGNSLKPEGTVFRITPSGVVTTLADFNGNNGAVPLGNLVQASDGNFYGTTASGGLNNGGTLFKMTPRGALVVLYNFAASSSATTPPYASDGPSSPYAGLVQGRDGALYGTTKYGTATGTGTVYKAEVNLSSPTLTLQSIAALSDGTSRVLWNQGNGAGIVWTLNASGAKTAVGPTYGPYTGSQGTWAATAIKAAGDGSPRILWNRSDGAAGVWTLNAQGNLQTVGPAYGPFVDSNGHWNATGLAVAADGTARILWDRSDGAAGVWTLNASDAVTVIGPTYGPYSGFEGTWSAQALCTMNDGTSRILWTQSTGAAGLWVLDSHDTLRTVGPAYGPFGDSHFDAWGAVDVGVSGDGTARVLWSRTDGAAGLWSFDAMGTETHVGPTYGPYRDNSGIWSATGVATANDGTSHVAWQRTDGAAGVWSFTSADTEATIGSSYGPY